MKTHRGLSAVIGTVFLIAVVVGALSYISFSVDTMGNFSEQLIAEESRQKNIQDENFDLITIDIDTVTNKLDATIKNTGEIPLKITTMYLDKLGDSTDVVQKINIDQTIAPGNSFDFLSESIDVDIESGEGYSMKLVSGRGETQTFYLNSAGQESLDIQLIALPNRIPTGFTTTIMMVVVNNMSNNNPLVNLVPIEPTCTGICTEIGDGPFPASYDILEPGDVAIFEWVYELDGNDGEFVDFTSGLVGGVSGNTATETVTVTSVQVSELAGQSIDSLGFGQSELAEDLFVLHLETYGIPSLADYQMHTSVPDNAGETKVLDGTEDVFQWFSANVTLADTTIAAGVWNASLRYNHDRLPSGMAAGASSIHDSASSGGGHTLHFNTDASTARRDSGQMSTCTNLVDNGSMGGDPEWGAAYGKDGSGAFRFDGTGDYISIDHSTTKKACNNMDDAFYSMAGWFKGDITTSDDTQTILWKWTDTGDCGGGGSDDCGGFRVEIGDGTSNEHGVVFFRMVDKNGDNTVCKSDEPDGGDNYLDGTWHHFAAVEYADGKCKLYMNGVEEDDESGDATEHDHYESSEDNDVYIGATQDGDDEFTGYLDDIMFWNYYALTASDVTALHEYSFGEDATMLNIALSNSTGTGVTDDILASSPSFGVPWGDQMDFSDNDGTWAGGNWTSGLIDEVSLSMDSPFSRLNFTIAYASGESLNLRIDDSSMDGSSNGIISSFLQAPPADPELPVFHTHDRDNQVTFFAFNTSGGEGVWFTYQGTRIVFNGTNGHYTGIVDSVSNGVDMSDLSADTDSPFVDEEQQADIVFWHPQSTPKAEAAKTSPTDLRIPTGDYDVSVFLNGYDEDGTVFIRTIGIGTVLVVD